MKILHIGKYYPPFSGGIENFMADLLPLIQSPSIQVCALVHDHSLNRLPREEIIDQVRIIRVPTYGRLLYAPISPAFPFYLHQILKQFKPDVLHIHMPNTSAFWVLFSILAKPIPWVIHWHSDVIGSAPNKAVALAYRIYKPFEQTLLKKCKKIIVTSPNYLQSSSALKAWADKARIIPLGLPGRQKTISQTNKSIARKIWGNDKIRLLSIGRLTYYKGHQYLIEAMQDLPQSRLVIVGQGEEHRSLQTLIERLNLHERVCLTGKLESNLLHALLDSCDIFCLPSIERTEAFGLVLLEAMYYAKPVMVSDIPGSGMTWVCQNNKTGVHTLAGDSKDIARKLKNLSQNTPLCQTLGKNGKARLEQYFDLKLIADDIIKLYHHILFQ